MKCLNSRTTYLKPKLIAVQKKRIKIIHCNLQIKYTLRKILQFQRSIDPLDNPLRGGGLFFFQGGKPCKCAGTSLFGRSKTRGLHDFFCPIDGV